MDIKEGMEFIDENKRECVIRSIDEDTVNTANIIRLYDGSLKYIFTVNSVNSFYDKNLYRNEVSPHFCRIDYLYENIQKYLKTTELKTGQMPAELQHLGIVISERTYALYFKTGYIYFEIIIPCSFMKIKHNTGEFYKTCYVYIKESTNVEGLDVNKDIRDKYLIPEDKMLVQVSGFGSDVTINSVGCHFCAGNKIPFIINSFRNYKENEDFIWDNYLYNTTHYHNFVDYLKNS